MWHTGDSPDCHWSNKGSQHLWIRTIICTSSKYRILSWGTIPSLYVFESEMSFDEHPSGFRHLSITFISLIQCTVYIPVPPHGHASGILPKSKHHWKRSTIRVSMKQVQGSGRQNWKKAKPFMGVQTRNTGQNQKGSVSENQSKNNCGERHRCPGFSWLSWSRH